MFEFKVRRCTRSRSHGWTDCPFAHPGEKARCRDPRKYNYSGAVCVEHRHRTCSRGDNCEFNHSIFELWLHPSRSRTEACKDGKNCQRKVCFFAHTPRQLRVPDQQDESPPAIARKYQAEPVLTPLGNHHCLTFRHSVNSLSSPRSALLDMSNLWPPASPSSSLLPQLSPLKNRSLAGFSPASLFTDRFIAHSNTILSNRCGGSGNFSDKDVWNGIINNFDSVETNERRIGNHNLAWLDVPNMTTDELPQLLLSPSTPSPLQSLRGKQCPQLGTTRGRSRIDMPGHQLGRRVADVGNWRDDG